MHCVDLGESFQTHIFLQNLASIQRRTSPVKLPILLSAESAPLKWFQPGRGHADERSRGRGRPSAAAAAPHAEPSAHSVYWTANKRFEISKFKFKFPRARTYEIIGLALGLSKPNFASKCSLESSRRDLHNALLCTVLESIGEKWGKKGLAKTTPKRKKTRKREANKQRAASHLELQRKGAAEKHRENKE